MDLEERSSLDDGVFRRRCVVFDVIVDFSVIVVDDGHDDVGGGDDDDVDVDVGVGVNVLFPSWIW